MVRIVHITDLHYEPEPERVSPGVGQALAAAIPLILAQHPDLVVCSGDLTSHGSARQDVLEHAKTWLDRLKVPYLAIAGNHDLGANLWRGARFPEGEAYEEQPFAQTHFGRIFGPSPVVEADLGTIAVVGFSLREQDPDGSLQALRAALDSKTKPVVLFGHYPVMPVRQRGILDHTGADDFVPGSLGPLKSVIDAHPQVRLYLCGHIHIASVVPINGHCLQLTSGGLGCGASVFRSFAVGPQQIEWQSFLGAGPLDFWSHAAPGFSEPPEYQLGEPSERAGDWPLQ